MSFESTGFPHSESRENERAELEQEKQEIVQKLESLNSQGNNADAHRDNPLKNTDANEFYSNEELAQHLEEKIHNIEDRLRILDEEQTITESDTLLDSPLLTSYEIAEQRARGEIPSIKRNQIYADEDLLIMIGDATSDESVSLNDKHEQDASDQDEIPNKSTKPNAPENPQNEPEPEQNKDSKGFQPEPNQEQESSKEERPINAVTPDGRPLTGEELQDMQQYFAENPAESEDLSQRVEHHRDSLIRVGDLEDRLNELKQGNEHISTIRSEEDRHIELVKDSMNFWTGWGRLTAIPAMFGLGNTQEQLKARKQEQLPFFIGQELRLQELKKRQRSIRRELHHLRGKNSQIKELEDDIGSLAFEPDTITQEMLTQQRNELLSGSESISNIITAMVIMFLGDLQETAKTENSADEEDEEE